MRAGRTTTACSTPRTRRAITGAGREASENLARGEWQCSRVYTVLGRGEPALATRCVASRSASRARSRTGTAVRVRGDCARARVAGTDRRTQWNAKARGAGDKISDQEDREHFDEDLANITL